MCSSSLQTHMWYMCRHGNMHTPQVHTNIFKIINMLFASGSSPTIPEYSGILPPHSKNCSLSQQQLLQSYMQLVLPQSLVCKQNLTLPITISSLKQPIHFLYPPITEPGFLNLRLVDYTSGGALIQSDTPYGYDRYLTVINT